MASVLVVEDNPDLRDMYAEILSMGDHDTRTAETAAEAVAAVQVERPSVLVLDLGIAGGVEPVLAELRGEPRVAVILASGARDLAERASEIGAQYLQKPFGPEQLLEAVERAARHEPLAR